MTLNASKVLNTVAWIERQPWQSRTKTALVKWVHTCIRLDAPLPTGSEWCQMAADCGETEVSWGGMVVALS